MVRKTELRTRLGVLGIGLTGMLMVALGSIAFELRQAQVDHAHADYTRAWQVDFVDSPGTVELDASLLVLTRYKEGAGSELTLIEADTGAIVRHLVTPADYDFAAAVMTDDGEVLLSTSTDPNPDAGAEVGTILWRSKGEGWIELAQRPFGPGKPSYLHWGGAQGGVFLGEHSGQLADTGPDRHHVLGLRLDEAGIPEGQPTTLYSGDLEASATMGEDIVVLGSRYDTSTGRERWEPTLGRHGRDGSTRWQRAWPVRMWRGHGHPREIQLVPVGALVCVRERDVDPVRCVAAADGSPRWELESAGLAIGTDGTHLLVVDRGERAPLEVRHYATDGELVGRARVIAPEDADAYPRLYVRAVGGDGSVYASDERSRHIWRFRPGGHERRSPD